MALMKMIKRLQIKKEIFDEKVTYDGGTI